MQIDVFSRFFAAHRRPFTLRMAPMIDVIFLLLIFFLVAAKWRPQEDFLSLRMTAAQAQSLSIPKPEPLTIHIYATPTGCRLSMAQTDTVRINDATIDRDLALMMEELRKSLLSQKRFADDPIEIICAPEVKWDHLAKIYNAFYGAGLTDITFRMTE